LRDDPVPFVRLFEAHDAYHILTRLVQNHTLVKRVEHVKNGASLIVGNLR
jgi:hypothetical protein